ncbi:MAG TPA: hypothetical protein VG455_08530 [Acidimicrobiales bacterium]|nr:hypothetical protein [Acidimicrobiales bacterium]
MAGDADRAMDLPFLASLATRHDHLDVQIWPGRHDLPLAQPRRCADLVERVAAGAGG